MRWRLCILAACLLFLLVGCNRSSKSPILEMICLDVGQGSSTLVRTAEGDILVDAGSEDSQDELCRKLRALGVERLSLLILTHPDEDHIGGADGVLEHFETDVIWTNGAIAENDRIGYIADYPIYGVPASINAFALGARLTNPRTKV